ncbi:hypothetical protein CF326_g1010 [Tilletia indica]|nr:hypothetical protein CF326_g1010 [Tilletia indica]
MALRETAGAGSADAARRQSGSSGPRAAAASATTGIGSTTAAASAPSSSSSSSSQQCPQCRDLQTNFCCGRCLSEQLRAYQHRVNRVRDLCSGARDRIARILGPVPHQLTDDRASVASLASSSTTSYDSRPASPQDHLLAATVTLGQLQHAPTSSTKPPQQRPSFQAHHEPAHSYASDLVDPFGDPGSDYSRTVSGTSSSTIPSPSTQRSLPPILPHRYVQQSQTTHIVRTVRAERAHLLRRFEEARLTLAETRQRIKQLQQDKVHKRTTLDRRRNNLREAKALLQADEQRRGSKGESNSEEGRNWRMPIGRRNQERVEDSSPSGGSGGLGCEIRNTESEIKILRTESDSLVKELSRTRAILAKETFSLFLVVPTAQTPTRQPARHSPGWTGFGSSPLSLLPDSMPAAFVSPLRRPGVEGRLTAAGLRQGNPIRQPASMQQASGATPAASNSGAISPGWTIVSLPLAIPAEVRKYSREDINGALSYTSLLLQLLSAYLGVSMPFVIESQGGRNIIMPNELWPGTYAKEHIIQLTENAYEALKVLGPTTGDRNSDPNAGSAFGLGASALSVLESFVQLPSTARLTSMLGPSGSESTYRSSSGGSPSSSGTLVNRNQGGAAGSEASAAVSGRSAAVDEYVTVISMLSYNAAYFAHVQDVRVDLVAAATSPLAVLARAMSARSLGSRAHGTYAAKAHIRNLGRADMDWNQVRLVLDPYRGGGGVGTGGSNSSASTSGSRIAPKNSRGLGLPPSRSKGATGSGTALSAGSSKGEFSTRTRRTDSSRSEGQDRGGEDDWDVVDRVT